MYTHHTMASPPEFPPLERRFIEVKVNGGGGMISKNKYNALVRNLIYNFIKISAQLKFNF